MQCLKELQVTDYHKIGGYYYMITAQQELLRLNRQQKIIQRRKMLPGDRFKFKLLCHLSSTMAGIKPITVMRFRHPQGKTSRCSGCIQHWQEINKHFKDKQSLGMRVMDSNQKSEALLFFHREASSRLLNHPKCRDFLQSRGMDYQPLSMGIIDPENFIDFCLEKFQTKGSLPVEMGLFMGIPLKDVKGYIKASKDHAACAGWRIYNPIYPSLTIANFYRRLSQYAVTSFFKNSFGDIAQRLEKSRCIQHLGLLTI